MASFKLPFHLYFLLPGVFALCGAAYFVIEDQQFRASARSAEGTVVELVLSRQRDGDRQYLPEVTYTTKAGKERSFVESDNLSMFGYHKGQTVTVLYRRGGRDERLDNISSRVVVPGLIGLMGLILTGVGLSIRRQGLGMLSEEASG